METSTKISKGTVDRLIPSLGYKHANNPLEELKRVVASIEALAISEPEMFAAHERSMLVLARLHKELAIAEEVEMVFLSKLLAKLM